MQINDCPIWFPEGEKACSLGIFLNSSNVEVSAIFIILHIESIPTAVIFDMKYQLIFPGFFLYNA